MTEIKSNIMPISNIYVVTDDPCKDRNFQRKIRGSKNINRMIKMLYPGKKPDVRIISGLLESFQKDELYNEVICPRQTDQHDMVYGIINNGGRMHFYCHCYEENCPSFGKQCRWSFNPETSFRAIVRPADWKHKQQNWGTTVEPDIKIILKGRAITPNPSHLVNQALSQQENKANYLDTSVSSHILESMTESEENIAANNLQPNQAELNNYINIINKSDEEEQAVDQVPYRPIENSIDLTSLDGDQSSDFIISQQQIIKGALNDRMLILAGPGTGKTYCLIEKLKYLLSTYSSLKPDTILILCFTTAAVRELNDRLKKALEGSSSIEKLQSIEIVTFDSFTTNTLIRLSENVTGLDYDQRIVSFSRVIENNPIILKEMSHFFVDEIQDLVGVRAELVKVILDNISDECGFTLLGDPLQGIYDFSIKDDSMMKSDDLLEYVKDRFGEELETISLHENRRQSPELATFSNCSRKQLLEHKEYDFLEHVKNLELCGKESSINLKTDSGRLAILCPNNGQVLRLSNYLWEDNISHIIKNRRTKRILPSWIGNMLETGPNTVMDRSYLEEWHKKMGLCLFNDIEKLYRNLISLVPSSMGKPKQRDIIAALQSGRRIGDDLYEDHNWKICVSTIHQAKGREIENVILLSPDDRPPKNPFDEAKIYYVGITRARELLKRIQRDTRTWFSSQHSNVGRMVEMKRNWGRRKNSLTAIEIGWDGDLDELSFNDDHFCGDSRENQEYILTSVHPGDPVNIIAINGSSNDYVIIHKGHTLGRLSYSFKDSVDDIYKNIYYKSKYRPREFSRVCVERIYTVVGSPSNPGIWYAVQVAGMGIVH